MPEPQPEQIIYIMYNNQEFDQCIKDGTFF